MAFDHLVAEWYSEASFWDLRNAIGGTLITPDDPAYDGKRRGWDLAVDQRPAVILVAADADDVAAGVRFAWANHLGVAIMSTGHGVVVPGDDSLLIVTSQIKGVQLDEHNQTAWVGAGNLWQDVLDVVTPVGLAPLLGSSPYVGVVGYTLGGGMGWLARKYGLSADSVNEIEIVTPDGEIRRANKTENADLFWGVRGGGGNFGVITGMEIKLYPVATLYGGELMYPIEMLEGVLRHFREWIATAPDELTSSVTIFNYPPLPELPDFLRGKKFALVKAAYTGAPEQGEALIQKWLDWATPLNNTFRVMPFSEVGSISADPVDPLPGYYANEMMDHLSDEAIDVIVRYTTQDHTPLLFTGIRHGRGAMATADRSANAIGNRDALLILEFISIAPTPEVERFAQKFTAQFQSALRDHTTNGVYLNFMARDQANKRTKHAYTKENYERLMALKAKYDPENMFRYSFHIPVGEAEYA